MRLLGTAAVLLFGPLLLVATASADANDGEYLGFKLGDRYALHGGLVRGAIITGALHYAVDPEHRHQHIGSLSLYVSPKSFTIGSIFGEWYFSSARSAKEFSERYMASLVRQYGDWKRRPRYLSNGTYQLWVDVEEKSPFLEDWAADKQYRVSVGLIYLPDSPQRKEWMARLERESNDRQFVARK